MIIPVSPVNEKNAVATALKVLTEGGIIAYPTETFYALGARYDHPVALERLCSVKSRATDRTLPLIIGSEEHLSLLAEHVPTLARRLMGRFWPGPLTVVLPARADLDGRITSGGKVALRIPGESFALRLAKVSPFPVTATSANISGKPPADTASMVTAYFGDSVDAVFDGGKTPGGLPSTIVDAAGETLQILREGAIPARDVLLALTS